MIPILHFAGALTFPLLVVLSFLAGVPWSAHSGSQSAVVPDLLGEDVGRVAQANALLQTLSRLAYFAGPALGGVLLAAFGAPAVLLIDAGFFALLASGPALDNLDIGVVWGAIAALQTAAAAIFAHAAFLRPGARDR